MPLLNVVIDLYHGDEVDDAHGFHAIQDAGIVAVIHKATEGLTGDDGKYAERRERAKSVGLLWGSYHFGHRGSPVAQADHYLKHIQPADGELVCLDFEQPKSQPAMTRAEAEAFVTHVHQRLGRYPVLYTGQSFICETLGATPAKDTVLSKCPLWVARYSEKPPEPPIAFSGYVLWQYTGDGEGPGPHTVPGISGKVDRSKFAGTPDALKAFWGK